MSTSKVVNTVKNVEEKVLSSERIYLQSWQNLVIGCVPVVQNSILPIDLCARNAEH